MCHTNATGLAKQAELELLLVNHNRLTGVVPQDWATPQLLRLDLQHNNLTGGYHRLLQLLLGQLAG